jgi:ubiquinone/menaquinone biosynthesis C-methylase UbiE
MNTNEHTKKELIAQVFDRAAIAYGELPYLAPYGRRLVELAEIPRGARVLDVATGRGAVLFPAAERVGENGCVIGTDLSEQMVSETCAEAAQRGFKQVQLCQMDAEQLQFSNASFDVVLCGFALFFFPHLERALAEFRRVLKPYGRLAVSTWGEPDSRWDWYDDLLTEYGGIVKLRTQMLDQRRELEAALSLAGFTDIQIFTEQMDWLIADEREWWNAQWAVSARLGLERLEPTTLERLRAEAFEKMQTLKQPDGFHDMLQAHLTVARNDA